MLCGALGTSPRKVIAAPADLPGTLPAYPALVCATLYSPYNAMREVPIPQMRKLRQQRGLRNLPKATYLVRGVKPRLETATAHTCLPGCACRCRVQWAGSEAARGPLACVGAHDSCGPRTPPSSVSHGARPKRRSAHSQVSHFLEDAQPRRSMANAWSHLVRRPRRWDSNVRLGGRHLVARTPERPTCWASGLGCPRSLRGAEQSEERWWPLRRWASGTPPHPVRAVMPQQQWGAGVLPRSVVSPSPVHQQFRPLCLLSPLLRAPPSLAWPPWNRLHTALPASSCPSRALHPRSHGIFSNQN